MLWRIDVLTRPGQSNPAASSALAGLREAGASPDRADAIPVYLVEGELSRERAERLAREAILDPVTETCRVTPANEPPAAVGRVVTVFKKPGVMDPVEASALKT